MLQTVAATNDALFEEWQVYEKLLIHDYMDHRAFFQRLQQEILARFEAPVALLDLGCGDLSPILPLLRAVKPREYVGIDRSATALQLARSASAGLGVPATLLEGELLEQMAGLDNRFEVIVASFSLHHLDCLEAKQQALAASRRLLAPAGVVAVIDVFREPQEDRAGYLRRWIDHADRHYATLADGEKRLLFDHVRARDFPETVEEYRSIGAAAGLDGFELLQQDAHRINAFVMLSR